MWSSGNVRSVSIVIIVLIMRYASDISYTEDSVTWKLELLLRESDTADVFENKDMALIHKE